jgi:hypothetical protein
MAASSKDKRTPITTPPYQVPSVDVTPDPPIFLLVTTFNGYIILKVPKCEIFDRSDFPDFHTIKSSWVGNLVVKILAYYFNF